MLLAKYTNKVIPWGILTGIRPVKLVNELIDEKMTKSDILTVLQKDYFVTKNKSRLLYEVAVNQRKLFSESKENSISLYIGIPFCPTRCLYCSFSSSTIGQYKKMVDVYVDTLLKEIKHTAMGGSVRAINAKGCAKFSRKEIDALVEVVKTYKAKGMAWISINQENEIKSSFAKFMSEEEMKAILERAQAEAGDLICFVADKNNVVFDALGQLRLEIARKLDILNLDEFKFLWVTEFPLFEYDEEEQRWVAKHHPFTSPMDEDLEYLDTDPGKVRAKAYDMH